MRHNILRHVITASIILGGAIVLGSSDPASSMPASSGAGFLTVINPQVPESVTLCGSTVSLDNVDYYERFDRELTALTYTHGNTLLTIKRANRYFPQMAPILRANGVPEDMLYLACIESTLNPCAVSPAKAAGIWQFIPSTAKEYGLEVNDEVDERFNIEKETAAACRYFKRALSKYGGSWTAVMASYNAGMARISGQLADQLAEEALDLHLVDETMRYPFRIMAMKVIMEKPADYGFILSADQLYYPREVSVVEVDTPVENWAEWAASHGINYRILRDENPWIRATKLTNRTGKTYKVRVPTAASLSRATAPKPIFNPDWVIN